MKATEQGVRAFHYAHGQIWDSYRGLTEAFQVDTGQSLDQPIPTWDSLTLQQQQEFVLRFRPLLGFLVDIASKVTAS